MIIIIKAIIFSAEKITENFLNLKKKKKDKIIFSTKNNSS